jgi:hypothetical protein
MYPTTGNIIVIMYIESSWSWTMWNRTLFIKKKSDLVHWHNKQLKDVLTTYV